MSLLERLRAEIAASGPLTVAQYMHRCLHDPRDGYYATRPALGERGDFITAPLVSQMFGELIGLWAAEIWTRLGSPARVRLVEVGPGDGTLMSDMLRAARVAPGFLDAAEVWLVEVSQPLKALQAVQVPRARWAADLSEVPADAPLILIANEFLDCLPARQFVRTESGLAERLVGAAGDGLAFGLTPVPAPAADLPSGPVGEVLEISPAQAAFGQAVGERIARDGGSALLIDYGRTEPGFGDTLQALKGHEKVDPLACPGEADLTVHVDFPTVLAAARKAGAATALLRQGDFLRRLGIEQRAAALAQARPDRADTVGRQLDRLIAPDQMGRLFKAACVHAPDLVPPGFEEVL
jgi:NADH dehydrogenase [ubiquinone] 1 alpha subcomplex assembly factor 7